MAPLYTVKNCGKLPFNEQWGELLFPEIHQKKKKRHETPRTVAVYYVVCGCNVMVRTGSAHDIVCELLVS